MSKGHISILMATYNGARWLPDQLNSLLDQTHSDWSLWVSDDGSSDETRGIVARFAEENPGRRIELLRGPGQGPTRNFLSLVARVDGHADAYAFCDQDDVWLPHRLSHGLLVLNTARPAGPVLVGHRTRVVDDALKPRGLSPMFRREPCFGNALVQSIAGGNTMLMNRDAFAILQSAGNDLDVVTHDWWAYQLISGSGGRVIYDERPVLLYRQHDRNLIGANTSLQARWVRIQALFKARFRQWNTRNLNALDACRHLLTPEAVEQMVMFRAVRDRRGLNAVRTLRRSGLVRQTRLGTLSLYLAAAIGKL